MNVRGIRNSPGESPWIRSSKTFVSAFRRLLEDPGFSLIVILILGLGIGANSVIFTLVRSIRPSPLPYPESDPT